MKIASLLLALVTTAASAQLSIKIPGATQAAPNDVTVEENGVNRSITCSKNNVYLKGNKGTFKIDGTCAAVHVMGNGNTVEIDRADRIVTEGNENTVNYRYPNAGVSNPGNGNKLKVVP